MSETGEGTNQQSQAPSDTIQISKQEYAQMIAANSQMRSQMEMLVSNLEQRQAQEQQSQAQAKANPNMPTNDVDSMSNTQLVTFIQQQMAQPILNTVMQLAVKEELRDLKGKVDDFDTYKDAVYSIASKNTSLTLEQAYDLAKSQTEKAIAQKTKETKETKPSDKPSTNPDSNLASVSQKPTQSVSSNAVQNNGTMTARQAAEAALAQIQYS